MGWGPTASPRRPTGSVRGEGGAESGQVTPLITGAALRKRGRTRGPQAASHASNRRSGSRARVEQASRERMGTLASAAAYTRPKRPSRCRDRASGRQTADLANCAGPQEAQDAVNPLRKKTRGKRSQFRRSSRKRGAAVGLLPARDRLLISDDGDTMRRAFLVIADETSRCLLCRGAQSMICRTCRSKGS